MRDQPLMPATISGVLTTMSRTHRPYETENKLLEVIREYSNSIYGDCYRLADGNTEAYVFKVNIIPNSGASFYTDAYSSVIEYMNKNPSATTELVRLTIGGDLHKSAFLNTNMWFARETVRLNGLTFRIGGRDQLLTVFDEWASTMEYAVVGE